MYNDIFDKDLLRKPKLTRWTSGLELILCWFIFWPLGIYLTYKRARIDKKAAISISIFVIILGVFFLAGMFYTSSNKLVDGSIEDIVALVTIGGTLISIGIYTIRSAKRFLRYIDLVVEQEVTSLDSIAGSMSTSYDVAKKDLQKLISDGYLTGSYIDDSTREVVFPRRNPNQYTVTVNDLPVNNVPQAVTCKSCGANNKVIIGAVGECEFCGSPIGV